MTFSDDLKNNVNIDIDEYEQKVDTRLDELLNKYIKGNDGFLEEYYTSTGVGNTDLSKIPFEEKKAILEEEFKSSDHDNNTSFYDEFQNKYEAYVVEQETGKKEVIEILLAVQKRFAQRIKTVSKKLAYEVVYLLAKHFGIYASLHYGISKERKMENLL